MLAGRSLAPGTLLPCSLCCTQDSDSTFGLGGFLPSFPATEPPWANLQPQRRSPPPFLLPLPPFPLAFCFFWDFGKSKNKQNRRPENAAFSPFPSQHIPFGFLDLSKFFCFVSRCSTLSRKQVELISRPSTVAHTSNPSALKAKVERLLEVTCLRLA